MQNMIDSIIRQTYENWELIIVDNDSVDDTAGIALDYSKTDSRIQYCRTGGGLSTARNCGIRKCTGDYIAFADCDDTLPEDSLEVRCRAMEGGYGMVLGKHILVRKDEQECCVRDIPREYRSGADFLKRAEFFETGHITGLEYVWDKLFLRRLITCENIQFSIKINKCDDAYFVLEYLQRCNLPIKCIDNIVCKYVIHDNQSSAAPLTVNEIAENISAYYGSLMKAIKRYNLGSQAEQGVYHGYLNKIIGQFYRVGKIDGGQKLEEFCRGVLELDMVIPAAENYSSKNEREGMQIVELIREDNAEKLADYLLSKVN